HTRPLESPPPRTARRRHAGPESPALDESRLATAPARPLPLARGRRAAVARVPGRTRPRRDPGQRRRTGLLRLARPAPEVPSGAAREGQALGLAVRLRTAL